MSVQAQCPECRKEFSVKNHLKYGVKPNLSFIKLAFRNIAFPWNNGLEETHNPNLVVCPQCGNEFDSKGYKYFGFIGAGHFQIALVVAIFLFIISFLAALIWGAVR